MPYAGAQHEPKSEKQWENTDTNDGIVTPIKVIHMVCAFLLHHPNSTQ